jgi:hypothetical protein
VDQHFKIFLEGVSWIQGYSVVREKDFTRSEKDFFSSLKRQDCPSSERLKRDFESWVGVRWNRQTRRKTQKQNFCMLRSEKRDMNVLLFGESFDVFECFSLHRHRSTSIPTAIAYLCRTISTAQWA